jgi:hypothetical protein
MSFTLLSLVFLGIALLGVFIEVRRGLRRGFVYAAVGLSTVLVSAVGAVALALWLSDKPAELVATLLENAVPALETFEKTFPHVTDILVAVADALVTPFLFVGFFLALRLILRIVASILLRAKGYDPDDPRYMGTPRRPAALRAPTYEAPDAPWHRRHDRLLGGLAGGLCGFLAALCILSPVLGMLSTSRTLLRGLRSMKVSLNAMLPAETLSDVEYYVNDSGAAILSASGGDLIFDATAVTELDGTPLTLRREVKTCMDVCYDFSRVIRVITNPGAATDEQKEIIYGLGDRMEESAFTRVLAADFLNSASAAWLEGETFIGIQRPSFGDLLDPILTAALEVCGQSTSECAARDITTVLRIYLIIVDSGLTTNPDRDSLMAALDEGGVMDKIYAELRKNPCMRPVEQELNNVALRIMAETIDWANFAPDTYRDLMDSLSEAMNLVNGMEGATFDERVKTLTEYTMHYAEQYGMELPESMAQMAATAMIQQLTTDGQLSADHLEEFFNHYLGKEN